MEKKLFLIASLIITLLLPGCDSSTEYGHGPEPRGDFFRVGNGRLLSTIRDNGSHIYLFEYDERGLLRYIGVNDNSYDVVYNEFEFIDDRRIDSESRWGDFYFSPGGFVERCTYKQKEMMPRTDIIIDYTMRYRDDRLRSITACGDGYKEINGRYLIWSYDADIVLSWHNNQIEQVSLSWIERGNNRTIAEREVHCSYLYSDRHNECCQYPMVISHFMAELGLFSQLGLLGLGPTLLPAEYFSDTVIDYENGIDYNRRQERGPVSFLINSDGVITSEAAWTQWGYEYYY